MDEYIRPIMTFLMSNAKSHQQYALVLRGIVTFNMPRAAFTGAPEAY
jgi:hypothetical protein